MRDVKLSLQEAIQNPRYSRRKKGLTKSALEHTRNTRKPSNLPLDRNSKICTFDRGEKQSYGQASCYQD